MRDKLKNRRKQFNKIKYQNNNHKKIIIETLKNVKQENK